MNSKDKLFWGEFLELYKSMPCLWKVKSSEYCNRELKNKCYKKMVEKLKEYDPDANREKVVKKINVFRTNYKRDLKKMKESEKSGAGADEIFQSSLWYFEKLKFLEDQQEYFAEEKFNADRVGLNIHLSDKIPPRPPSKKRKITAEENLLKAACQKLTNTENATTILAKGWAIQYEELSKAQKLFARTIFAQVLYAGCLDKLNENTVKQIQEVLNEVSTTSQTHNELSRTSSPYIHEYTQFSQSDDNSTNKYFGKTLFSTSPKQTLDNVCSFSPKKEKEDEINDDCDQ